MAHKNWPPTTKFKQRFALRKVISNIRKKDPGGVLFCELAVLEEVLAQMHNRKPVMRGRVTSPPADNVLNFKIKQLHAADPDMPQHEIAARLGTNGGRVSNALAGVRV